MDALKYLAAIRDELDAYEVHATIMEELFFGEEFGPTASYLYACAFMHIHNMKLHGDADLQGLRATLAKGENLGTLMLGNGLIDNVLGSWTLSGRQEVSVYVSELAALNRCFTVVVGNVRYATVNTVCQHVREGKPKIDVSLHPVRLSMFYCSLRMSDPYQCLKLMRPVISLKLIFDDRMPLGRLLIELYTECAPPYVWDLVKTCSAGSAGMFSLKNVRSRNWLTVEKSPQSCNVQPSEAHTCQEGYLSHGQAAGILGLCKKTFHSMPDGGMQFSLSYKANVALDLDSIPIGRVIAGMKIIEKLAEIALATGGYLISPLGVAHCDWVA